MNRRLIVIALASAVFASVGLYSQVANSQSPPAVSHEAQGGVSDPFLIVPGMSIGAVRLGMPMGDVVALLGHYFSKDTAIPGFPSYTWNALPEHRLAGRFLVSAWVSGDSEAVSAISVFFDARYATSKGIHIGDSYPKVSEIMGEPASIHPGLYDIDIWFYQGIAFAIGHSNTRQCANRVCAIGVGHGFGEIF